jgi:hypothetical protein
MAPAIARGQIGRLARERSRRMKIRVAVSGLLLAGMVHEARSQDAADGRWHYLVQPFVMFPNMKGETGIGNLPPAPIDEDPSDIFEHLQWGAMLFAEARNDRWAFSSDVLFMDLEADVTAGNLIGGGGVDVSQIGWELAAMRRLGPWFELGVGVTYNQIDVDVDVAIGGSTLSAGLEEEWIDPTVVARAGFPIGGKWSFQARANLGGFGVGSDLMWQLQADVGYRRSERWSFAFGYRVIDIDYDQGRNSGRFVYDVQTFGPVLKVGYSF